MTTQIVTLLLLASLALCHCQTVPGIRWGKVHILPLIRRTTIPPYPTPSMIDLKTWNFTKPSDFAKNCLKNQLGKTIVDYCQAKSTADWDPAKMNTSTTTTWDMCCSLYEELDCYSNNAHNFCQADLAKAVSAYSRKVSFYFNYSICKSVHFLHWERSCNKDAHAKDIKAHDALKNHTTIPEKIISLPFYSGPEKYCFRKLQANYTMVNRRRSTLVDKCLNKALDVWDPSRQKLKQSTVLESCCATFMALDCLVAQSSSVCTSSQVNSMLVYQKTANILMTSTICRAVPADQRAKVCAKVQSKPKSSAPSTGISILLLLSTLLCIFGFQF